MFSILAQARPGGVSMADAERMIGVQSFDDFVQLAQSIWTEGGWLMIPLAALAVFIFYEALALVMRLDRARLSFPFWWFALSFGAVLYFFVALAAKTPVLSLFGMNFDPEAGATVTQYLAVIAFGILVNPFLWAAVATWRRCKRSIITPAVWTPWLDRPEEGEGHIGDVLRYVVGNGINEETMDRIDAVRSDVVPDVNQKLTVLSSLVTLAPLMGLLGTVIGMLDTFRGLGSASGQAAELVADGIRVALITTQTGLTIAIPGYIFISLALRSRNLYTVFLTELESQIVQRIHRREDVAA